MNSPFSIHANGNRFSGYLKQYSFIQRFFSASGNYRGNVIFEKKILFLLVETDFLANGNHFFRFSCHWYLYFSVQWELAFKRVLHYGQWKRIFWLVETIFFFFFFFYTFLPVKFFFFFFQTFLPVKVLSCLVETYF